jgi:hypothetical protein
LGVALLGSQFNPAMNFRAVILGRKQYADARVVTKLENPVILKGGVSWAWGISKTLSAGSLGGAV